MLALIGVLAFAFGALAVVAVTIGAAWGGYYVLRDAAGLFKEAALLIRHMAQKH